MLLLACGRTEPVKPGRVPPVPPVPRCALSVEPRAIDFGTLPPGARVDRQLVLRDEGDGPCTVDAVTLGAANAPTFGLNTAPRWPQVLAPGGSLVLTVTFSAEGPAIPPAERRGTLAVHSSDPDEPAVEVTLAGRLSFCRLAASPSLLDLGNVALNTTVTGRVTLANLGSVACEVVDLRLEPDTDAAFTLPLQPTGLSVAPGASAVVTISFSARDSAPPHLRGGHLAFRSNDVLAPQGRVPLSAYINTLCTEAGQYIYTVDNGGQFSRFDPRTLTYTDIAPLRCPTSATPFSMNVDQNAIAWVIFGDGHLFHVDTATGECIATSYQPNQAGFFTYGMGSAWDSSTGTDTLYLSTLFATGPAALGKLSFPSLTVTTVGPLSIGDVELAGTGDGQLWAFAQARAAGNTAFLARLDPTTARVLERYDLSSVTSIGGWAIKFFGGAFYLFVGSDIWKVERSSLDPTRPTPSPLPTRVLVSPGRDIVGAGVSTCAPVQ